MHGTFTIVPAHGSVDAYVPGTHTNCSVLSTAFLTKDGSKQRFYIMQVLEQDPSNTWFWRRWGVAGRQGCCLLKGPFQQADAERTFDRLFRSKTKLAYTDASSGAPAITGHYAWVAPGAQIPALGVASAGAPARGRSSSPVAEWEFLEDPGDGTRPEQWRRFTREGSALAERLLAGAAATGSLRSGRFHYELDLSDPANFTQRNADVHPHTVRRIRRAAPA